MEKEDAVRLCRVVVDDVMGKLRSNAIRNSSGRGAIQSDVLEKLRVAWLARLEETGSFAYDPNDAFEKRSDEVVEKGRVPFLSHGPFAEACTGNPLPPPAISIPPPPSPQRPTKELRVLTRAGNIAPCGLQRRTSASEAHIIEEWGSDESDINFDDDTDDDDTNGGVNADDGDGGDVDDDDNEDKGKRKETQDSDSDDSLPSLPDPSAYIFESSSELCGSFILATYKDFVRREDEGTPSWKLSLNYGCAYVEGREVCFRRCEADLNVSRFITEGPSQQRKIHKVIKSTSWRKERKRATRRKEMKKKRLRKKLERKKQRGDV